MRSLHSSISKNATQHSGLSARKENPELDNPHKTESQCYIQNCHWSHGKQEVMPEDLSLEQDHSPRKPKLQPDSTNMESQDTETVCQRL